MRTAIRSATLTALLVVASLGCAKSKGGSQPEPQERTTLTVDNRNFLDFNIYLIVGSQRVRLGTATGNRRTTMTIPAQYIFGASSLQFLADPIGGRTTPVSWPITVAPGDEVELIIPPNA